MEGWIFLIKLHPEAETPHKCGIVAEQEAPILNHIVSTKRNIMIHVSFLHLSTQDEFHSPIK